jgi:transcription termination/antitermination protein NusA
LFFSSLWYSLNTAFLRDLSALFYYILSYFIVRKAVKLSQVIEELVEERGLDKGVLTDIVCEGILNAYSKKYPTAHLTVIYNRKSDELVVMAKKTVASTVTDELTEISPRKARSYREDAEVGESVEVPFEEPIGRIEILRAKQIISQRIRDIEAAAIYNQFKDKVGTVVHGVVHKAEHAGVTVKLNDALAFLPKSLMIPGERCPVGHTIKALLKEVLPEPRSENQLILDRASSTFVAKLFELEIPEVFEKIVEVKKVVRIPGYKSKIIVVSHDKNIDPVGTCIGVGGARIKPILRELGNEKVDVIKMTQIPEDLVRDALKPAAINRVEIIDDKNVNVWLDEDQRSLAIGKSGQNIALASQLVGMAIHLVKNETAPDFASSLEEQQESGENQ